MAEDFWKRHPNMDSLDQRAQAIVDECKRQEESCLYTSTALYSWQKEVRALRVAFIVLPIIFGSVATVRVFVRDPSLDWIVALCAFVAGLFPAIFKALDLDVSVKSIGDSANRFKSLQDRFRQASRIAATKSPDELEAEFKVLMDKMDEARTANPVVPERHFKASQKKIQGGAYSFDSVKD